MSGLCPVTKKRGKKKERKKCRKPKNRTQFVLTRKPNQRFGCADLCSLSVTTAVSRGDSCYGRYVSYLDPSDCSMPLFMPSPPVKRTDIDSRPAEKQLADSAHVECETNARETGQNEQTNELCCCCCCLFVLLTRVME